MRRILILFIIMFILTGCTAEYTLSYEENVFTENLKVVSNKSQEFVTQINNIYNDGLIVDYTLDLGDMSEREYILNYGNGYKQSIIDNNGLYGLTLGYIYENKEEVLKSTIANSLFKNLKISNDFIRAYNVRNIFDSYSALKEIKIVFITDKNVKKTNCDEEIDGKYIWNLNKENYKDKQISIYFGESNKELISEDGYLTGNSIKYILMLSAIIILISIVVIYEKVKKSNN